MVSIPTVPPDMRATVHGLAQCGYTYERIAKWLNVSKLAISYAYKAHERS